jgi:DTW domain-containing protein YfiP
VVRHHLEAFRATNTGRLVQLALGADLADHGKPCFNLTAEDLGIGPGACLLYPLGAKARAWAGGRPDLLVVPDGTWQQVRRLIRRVPGLRDLPRLELPASPDPPRCIRRRPAEGRCSTIEAVAQALAAWEDPAVPAALLRLYDRLGARMDEARGPRTQRSPGSR